MKLDMRTRNGLESTILLLINESGGLINTFVFLQDMKWARAISRLEKNGTVRRVPNDTTCYPVARYTIHKPDPHFSEKEWDRESSYRVVGGEDEGEILMYLVDEDAL